MSEQPEPHPARATESPAGPDGPWGSITDVPGVRVGHARRVGDGWLTGVTVVLPPQGAIGSVDVRGGGPGTHETDALDPTTLASTVDAICLTGGSAYGLASVNGVHRWCEEQGRGLPVGPPEDPWSVLVPIVPAAALFDLGRGGNPTCRPDADLGRQAALDAVSPDETAVRGAHGAGTGARIGRATLAGGIGTASVRLPGGIVVGALAAVNALGTPADPVTGTLLGSPSIPAGLPRPTAPTPAEAAELGELLAKAGSPALGTQTTLVVVATNAALNVPQVHRTAAAAHDGIARAVRPAHTLLDGDTVFALSTGEIELPIGRGPAGLVELQAAAADAVLLAILDAVLTAGAPEQGVPGYRQVCPSVRLAPPE